MISDFLSLQFDTVPKHRCA